MKKRFVITESEKNHIRTLYGLDNRTNLIKEDVQGSCPAFNDNVKNQVIDYQNIINTFSDITPSNNLEQVQNLITQKIIKHLITKITIHLKFTLTIQN